LVPRKKHRWAELGGQKVKSKTAAAPDEGTMGVGLSMGLDMGLGMGISTSVQVKAARKNASQRLQ